MSVNVGLKEKLELRRHGIVAKGRGCLTASAAIFIQAVGQVAMMMMMLAFWGGGVLSFRAYVPRAAFMAAAHRLQEDDGLVLLLLFVLPVRVSWH